MSRVILTADKNNIKMPSAQGVHFQSMSTVSTALTAAANPDPSSPTVHFSAVFDVTLQALS